MAVLRQTSQVHLPRDFGLSLTVISILAGVILLVAFVVSAIPTQGPRTEPRTPETGTIYTESAGPAAPASPVATH